MNARIAGRNAGTRRWIGAACRRDVTRRSIKVSLIVGTILVAVNYTDRFIAGSLEKLDYLKMLLTYLVPYCVSTYVSVATRMSPDRPQDDITD